MTEIEDIKTFDDLKGELILLRGEIEMWKAHVVEIMGIANRAQGFGEGVAGTQKILNDSFDRRLSALELDHFS